MGQHDHEDNDDFFVRMVILLDAIEVRRGEFLKMDPDRKWEVWGRLHRIHDDLEGVAVEIDREVRKARGEKVGPVVSLGTLARDLFSGEPGMRLVEITAEIHEALDAKRIRKGERNELWAVTPSGREYRLERFKSPHQEARYVVRAIREAKP